MHTVGEILNSKLKEIEFKITNSKKILLKKKIKDEIDGFHFSHINEMNGNEFSKKVLLK